MNPELSHIESRCAQLLELSRRMLDCAQQEEWIALADIEAQRQLILDSLFPVPAATSVGAGALLDACIRQVLSIDEKIMALGETSRVAMSRHMATLSRGQRANKAYQANGG